MYNNEFNLDFIHLDTNIVIKYVFKFIFLIKKFFMGKGAHKDKSAWDPPKVQCSPVSMPTLLAYFP